MYFLDQVSYLLSASAISFVKDGQYLIELWQMRSYHKVWETQGLMTQTAHKYLVSELGKNVGLSFEKSDVNVNYHSKGK